MDLKIAQYGSMTIEYDADALCWYCELPVENASMGGTIICPACDAGHHRDGRRWTYAEMLVRYKNFARHRRAAILAMEASHA